MSSFSRFSANQSAEYRAAVRALRALPADDAPCAYADAVHLSLLESFKSNRGIKQRAPGSHVCVHRLKGNRQCLGYSPSYSDSKMRCPEIPHGDHLSEWMAGGKTVAILSQPYGLGYEAMVETFTFCKENDLEVLIDTYPSFHYPGTVLSLVFTRRGFHLGPGGLKKFG